MDIRKQLYGLVSFYDERGFITIKNVENKQGKQYGMYSFEGEKIQGLNLKKGDYVSFTALYYKKNKCIIFKHPLDFRLYTRHIPKLSDEEYETLHKILAVSNMPRYNIEDTRNIFRAVFSVFLKQKTLNIPDLGKLSISNDNQMTFLPSENFLNEIQKVIAGELPQSFEDTEKKIHQRIQSIIDFYPEYYSEYFFIF